MNFKELIKITDLSKNKKKQAELSAIGALKGTSAIRSMTILTGQNPDSTPGTNRVNRQNNKGVRQFFKDNDIIYVPVTGKWGSVENSYAAMNLSLDLSMSLAGRYEQTSFIFVEVNEDGFVAKYYEKQDPSEKYSKSNPYVLKNSTTEMFEVNFDDNFTQIANKLKFNFNFKFADALSSLIIDSGFVNIYFNGVGHSAYMIRRRINAPICKVLDSLYK